MVWEIKDTVQDRPLRVLDVGPGWGKYERLLREYVAPDAVIDAVEAWEPYVHTHGLTARYNRVTVGDVRTESDGTLGYYDVVLLIDVIEHMPKPDGFALLERIPGWVVVSTPRDFFANPSYPPTEAHVSHWSVDDFTALPRFDSYDPELLAAVGAVVTRLRPVR